MKNQGNIKMTLLTLIPGILLLFMSIAFMGMMGIKSSYFIFGALLLGLSIFLVISGIIFASRCVITNKVKLYGKESECVVTGYYQTRNRYRTFNFIKYRYKGESGRRYDSKVEVSLNNIGRCPIGTKLYCKVLGENCYVNGECLRFVSKNETKNDFKYL